MNRRDFIKNSALSAAGLTLTGAAHGNDILSFINKKSNGKRPNILFIMTDQQFAGAMSCAGNNDLKTPAMDYIAKHGMRFKKAYSTTPLCVPARSSIFSGMHPHQVDAAINNLEAKWDTKKYPSMGTILKTAGYDTGYVGKWHLPIKPDEKNRHGFDYIMHARGNELDNDVPGCSRDFLLKKRDKPFMLVSSFVNPHDICQWARGEAMKNNAIPEAPSADKCPELPDNFGIGTQEPDILRELQTYSTRTYPTKDWDENKWRQYRWAYYRLIETVDVHIQKVLDALKESGEEDNTVIIFTSDHGDGHGAHQWNQKQVLYEESARVPFIISWKGMIKPGVDEKTIISTGIDIIPTMCKYANIEKPKHMVGRSLKRATDGKKSHWREYTIIQTEFCQSKKTFDIKGRCVISDKFKYMIYDKGEIREQLFDMQVDKGEMKNLAYKPEYKSIKDKHIKALKAWIKETDDSFKF